MNKIAQMLIQRNIEGFKNASAATMGDILFRTFKADGGITERIVTGEGLLLLAETSENEAVSGIALLSADAIMQSAGREMVRAIRNDKNIDLKEMAGLSDEDIAKLDTMLADSDAGKPIRFSEQTGSETTVPWDGTEENFPMNGPEDNKDNAINNPLNVADTVTTTEVPAGGTQMQHICAWCGSTTFDLKKAEVITDSTLEDCTTPQLVGLAGNTVCPRCKQLVHKAIASERKVLDAASAEQSAKTTMAALNTEHQALEAKLAKAEKSAATASAETKEAFEALSENTRTSIQANRAQYTELEVQAKKYTNQYTNCVANLEKDLLTKKK